MISFEEFIPLSLLSRAERLCLHKCVYVQLGKRNVLLVFDCLILPLKFSYKERASNQILKGHYAYLTARKRIYANIIALLLIINSAG